MSPRDRLQQHPALSAWRRSRATASAQLQAWWRQRQPREQRLLRLAAALLLLALLWLALLRPALDTVRQSRTQLPLLRAQAMQVETLVLEAQALRRGQAGRIDPAALPDALRASLRRTGIEAQATLNAMGVDSASTRQWEVRLEDANAARVIDWLAELPAQLQVRIAEVALARAQSNGRERPGNVSGRIVLELPGDTQ